MVPAVSGTGEYFMALELAAGLARVDRLHQAIFEHALSHRAPLRCFDVTVACYVCKNKRKTLAANEKRTNKTSSTSIYLFYNRVQALAKTLRSRLAYNPATGPKKKKENKQSSSGCLK